MTFAEFEVVNERYWVLLIKQYLDFTDEEQMRSFKGNTGWREERERRRMANLTAQEQTEFVHLKEVRREYLDQFFPPDLKRPADGTDTH